MSDTIEDVLRRRLGDKRETIDDVLRRRMAKPAEAPAAATPEAPTTASAAPTPGPGYRDIPLAKPAKVRTPEEWDALAESERTVARPTRRRDEILGEIERTTGNKINRSAFDPVKDAAQIERWRDETNKAHREALPAGMALAAHFGRTVLSGSTLGFYKGGMTDAEDRLVSANPTVQGPIGSAVGAAGTVLAAANPLGPIAKVTRMAKPLGVLAPSIGFGVATGIEHRSIAAGLEAAVFAGTAGAAGRLLKGADPGLVRRVIGEAAAVMATGAGMSYAKGEPIDWSSQAAQAALFGALAGAHKSPIQPPVEARKPVPREFSPVETVATQAKAKMLDAVAKAAPELDAAEHERIVETGDLTSLPPDVAARVTLATRPIADEFNKAHGEAVKAEAGAEPVDLWALWDAAREAHAKGEDPVAAAEAVKAEGFDPRVVPVEPAPVATAEAPRATETAPVVEAPVEPSAPVYATPVAPKKPDEAAAPWRKPNGGTSLSRHEDRDNAFAVSVGIRPDGTMYDKVPVDIGKQHQSHGVAKGMVGEQLDSVVRVLDNGFDARKPVYTAPFSGTGENIGGALGTADGAPYKDGAAVLVAGRGRGLVDGGVKHVFFNDALVTPETIDWFRSRYEGRGVTFDLLSDQTKILTSAPAAPAAPAAPRETPEWKQAVEVAEGHGITREDAESLADELVAPKKAVEKTDLVEWVRSEGGIDYERENLKGEADRLRQKESGTSGVVNMRGGGKTFDEMHTAAVSAGLFPEDAGLAKFIEALHQEAAPLRRQMTPDEAQAAKGGYSADEARQWADATPEQIADARDYDAERDAIRDGQTETRDAAGADDSFDFGANEPVEIRGADGEVRDGTFVHKTGARVVVDTENGRERLKPDEANIGPSRSVSETLGITDAKPRKVRERGATTIPSAVAESVADKAKAGWEKAKATWNAAKPGLRSAHDWVTMKVAPRISRMNPEAGRRAGGLINSSSTAALVVPEWSNAVFGDATPAEKQQFADAAVEFNLQTLRTDAVKAVADAPNPMAKIAAQARLDAIKTHLGDADFSFKTKAEMDAYWNGPLATEFRERHRNLWNGKTRLAEGLPSLEEMFDYMTKKGATTDDLLSVDPRDEMRLNMVALRDAAGEETTAKILRDAAKEGPRVFKTAATPENIRQKPHPYAKEFTGTGREYLRDYDGLIANSYARVLDRYQQTRMMDALNGDVVTVKDGEKAPDVIRGEKAVRIEVEVKPPKMLLREGERPVNLPSSHYYARASIVPELKQLLRLNDPVGAFKTAEIANAGALFGLADNVWNLALDTMIAGSAPGAGLRSKAGIALGSTVNNLVATARVINYALPSMRTESGKGIGRPVDANARALRLSTVGAWRESRTPEWTAESFREELGSLKGMAGIPFKALGRLSSRVHEAGRFVLDEAYTALGKIDPKTYPAEDATARREFVNRMGQYVGRGMGKWTQIARDSAVFPFVTAQRKSSGEVLRKATLSGGGVNGTPGFVRLGQAMKILGPLTLIGLINFSRTGNPTGRPGVPMFGLDSGENDEHGNPIYSDTLGNLTGVTQLATATGARAVLTGVKRGLEPGQIADATIDSLANSWLVKFASSPTTGFAWRAATGKDPYRGARPQTAESPGESENPGNVGYALRKAFQPADLVLSATGAQRQEDPGFGDTLSSMLTSVGGKRGTRDVATLPERIRYRQASERADYMVSQFKNMPVPARLAWIDKELANWTPGEVKANRRRLIRSANAP